MAIDMADGPVRDWIQAHAKEYGLEAATRYDRAHGIWSHDRPHIQLARGTPKTSYDSTPSLWAGDGQKLPSEDIPNPAAPSQPALRYTPGRAKMSGPAVADVQRKLDAAGYDIGPHGADGVYGKDTAAAVRAFEQATPGLDVDKGVVGTQVREALSHASPVPVSAGIADMIQRQAPHDFSIAGPKSVPTSSVGPDPILAGQDSFGRSAPFNVGAGNQPAIYASPPTGPYAGALRAGVTPGDVGSGGLNDLGSTTSGMAQLGNMGTGGAPTSVGFSFGPEGERDFAGSGEMKAGYPPTDARLSANVPQVDNGPGSGTFGTDLLGAILRAPGNAYDWITGDQPAAAAGKSSPFSVGAGNQPAIYANPPVGPYAGALRAGVTPAEAGSGGLNDLGSVMSGMAQLGGGQQQGSIGGAQYADAGGSPTPPSWTMPPGWSLGSGANPQRNDRSVIEEPGSGPMDGSSYGYAGGDVTPDPTPSYAPMFAGPSTSPSGFGGIGGVYPSPQPANMFNQYPDSYYAPGKMPTPQGGYNQVASLSDYLQSPVVGPPLPASVVPAGDPGNTMTPAGDNPAAADNGKDAAPDGMQPDAGLAGDPLGQVAAYDMAKANGLGAPKVAAVAPAVRVASPSVAPRVAAQAYGLTNSGYGTRYQAPASWGWGNSANAARSAGYTTGIASPQYAQIAASRGYSAPADAFTPGSGGAIYAYHANGQGGGTYVDSQGREHTY